MAGELQKWDAYYTSKSSNDMDYRQYMEKRAMVKDIGSEIRRSSTEQLIGNTIIASRMTDRIEGSMVRMQTGIQTSIRAQTFAIVASQAVLARTIQQGFDRINHTLDMGFAGVSNQLGEMTAAFSLGFSSVERAIEKMSAEICKRLDAIHDIVNNPLLTQSRELYRRALVNFTKGFYEEALEDIKQAIEKCKTDYISWFLMGKIYAFGAGEFGNVISLEESIKSFTQAAKYNSPDIAESAEAKLLAAEIYFFLGTAQYSQSNELSRNKKEAESTDMLAKALKSFEQSFRYSDKMLEALFNIARCKVLQGQKEEALDDLEELILLDRNYCIKILDDSDFDPIENEILGLIKKLKGSTFSDVKEQYEKINSLLESINSLNGTLTEKQEELISNNVPEKFTGDEPYFDILDKNAVYPDIIGELEKSLIRLEITLKREKAETQKQTAHETLLLKQIKNDIRGITEHTQAKTWWKNEKDRSFMQSKKKEYYMDYGPFGGKIRKEDIQKLVRTYDRETRDKYMLNNKEHGESYARSMNHIEEMNNQLRNMGHEVKPEGRTATDVQWAVIDVEPASYFDLKMILAFSDNDFLSWHSNGILKKLDSIDTDMFGGARELIILAPTFIEKLTILRANKQLAEELISAFETAEQKKDKYYQERERKGKLCMIISLLLLVSGIILGIATHSFLVGLFGVIIAIVLLIRGLVLFFES